MKTVIITAVVYLSSFLAALLLAAGVTYGINAKAHGGQVGIVVCYSIFLMAYYLAFFVPVLIGVHVAIRKACTHSLLPVVAILACTVGLLGIFHVYGLLGYGPRVAGGLMQFLFFFSIYVLLPVFSIGLGASAALWQYRASDMSARKKFRGFSMLTVVAAVLLTLTVLVFLFRFAQVREVEKIQGVEYVMWQDVELPGTLPLRSTCRLSI
jgi:hypothetical protein